MGQSVKAAEALESSLSEIINSILVIAKHVQEISGKMGSVANQVNKTGDFTDNVASILEEASASTEEVHASIATQQENINQVPRIIENMGIISKRLLEYTEFYNRK